MVKVQRLFAKTNLKIRVCGAKQNNESPSGAFEWQPGLAQARWRGFAPTRATSKRGSVAEVQSRKGTTFSRIENLWPRDGSCSVIAIAVVVIL